MLTASLVVALATFSCVTAQTAAADATALSGAKLVGASGEVIDNATYLPSVGVQLTFVDNGFTIDVLPGITLTRNQTEGEPTVRLASDTDIAGKAYLIAMVDPDAPTPENRNVSQVRHWLAQNFVARSGDNGLYELSKPANAEAVGAYIGPAPEAGIHRYTVLIFEQSETTIDAPAGDDVAPLLNFDIETYVALIDGLKLVGGTFFRSGPFGTEPNNGTYAPPTASTTSSGTGTGTAGAAGPSQSAPADGGWRLAAGVWVAAMTAGLLGVAIA